MPNWTDSEMGVILPIENVEKFLSYFLEYNKDEKVGLHYYRTFYESHEIEDSDEKYCKVRIYFSSAWTVQCMLERYEEDSTVVTLLDVCRECAVYRMECYSTEPSMGFVEEMVYNYGDDNIEFASHDFIACPQNMYFPDDQEIVEYIATTDKNKQEEKDNG